MYYGIIDISILAIDLGTGGPKVAVVSTQGEMVDSDFEATRLILLPEGGAEQSPREWWDAMDRCTKRLLWTRAAALANAIIWMNARGAPFINPLLGGPVKVQGYAPQKMWKWIQRTGGAPGTAGKDPVAHILYLKHVHPEIYRRTYKFLEPVDYLGLRLAGCFASSYNTIALHWLTDNRNIVDIHYDRNLIELVTLDPDKFPELKPTNAILGTLREEIARDWNLCEDVQVVMGSPDMQTVAVGSGAVQDYEAHLYIGTSSWSMWHFPYKKTDPTHNMAALPAGIPGRYLLTNEQDCTGNCLQYLRDNIFFCGGRRYAICQLD